MATFHRFDLNLMYCYNNCDLSLYYSSEIMELSVKKNCVLTSFPAKDTTMIWCKTIFHFLNVKPLKPHKNADNITVAWFEKKGNKLQIIPVKNRFRHMKQNMFLFFGLFVLIWEADLTRHGQAQFFFFNMVVFYKI